MSILSNLFDSIVKKFFEWISKYEAGQKNNETKWQADLLEIQRLSCNFAPNQVLIDIKKTSDCVLLIKTFEDFLSLMFRYLGEVSSPTKEALNFYYRCKDAKKTIVEYSQLYQCCDLTQNEVNYVIDELVNLYFSVYRAFDELLYLELALWKKYVKINYRLPQRKLSQHQNNK